MYAWRSCGVRPAVMLRGPRTLTRTASGASTVTSESPTPRTSRGTDTDASTGGFCSLVTYSHSTMAMMKAKILMVIFFPRASSIMMASS